MKRSMRSAIHRLLVSNAGFNTRLAMASNGKSAYPLSAKAGPQRSRVKEEGETGGRGKQTPHRGETSQEPPLVFPPAPLPQEAPVIESAYLPPGRLYTKDST